MNTDNVKFYLKNPRASNPTAIYLRVQLNRKPFKYYIHESINSKYWDFDSGMPLSDNKEISRLAKRNPTLRITLSNLQFKLSDIANKIVAFISLKAHNGETVDAEVLRVELDLHLGINRDVRERIYIVDYLSEFILEIETGKRLTIKGTRYALGTVKNYQGLSNVLNEFEKISQKRLLFNQFTIETYSDLVEWLQSKNLSLNTIGRHIKQLKAILRCSHQEGVHENEVYKDSRFRVFKVKSDEIYLTEKEIEQIYNLDLSDDPKLDLIRNVWLLGAYTGLRFSDFSRISPEYIVEGDGGKLLLSIYNGKSDRKTTVPLRSRAVEILKKYNFKLPKTYGQKVNKGIKEVGRLAGIDDEIEVLQFKGINKIKVKLPKYKMIKTHTGRRSTVTNMYKAGLSTVEIMSITGHRSEKTFFGYIEVTKEEIVDRLINHSYFK